MKNFRGFEGKTKRDPVKPVPDYKNVAVTRERLTKLVTELYRAHLTPRTVGMIVRLTEMTAAVRLVVNIKVILGLMTRSEIRNILTEGISDDERRVLLEIGASRLSKESKETAHALFELEARCETLDSLRKAFRRIRSAKDRYLREDEIKKIREM